MAVPIVRLYGRADNFDIEFTKGLDGGWVTTVPPDLEDGQYAVELRAVNSAGERAYWTGILYMHNGRACMHINKPRFVMWLTLSDIKLARLPPKNEIILERSCACGHINF